MITVTVSHQNWCKVSQQNPIVVRGQSGYRRKSLKPELVQRFAAKANSRTMVNQAITITVSHQNWCKVLQQKPIVIRDQSSDHRNSFTPDLVQSFAAKTNSRTWSVRRSPEKFHTRTGAIKVSQQKPVVIRGQSGDHRNSFTPELVQSFAAKTNSRVTQRQFSGKYLFGRRFEI